MDLIALRKAREANPDADLDLFQWYREGAPARTESDTSVAAAQEIQPHSETLRERVLGYVRGRKGATCDEVEVALAMSHQTASARIRELVKLGQLHDSWSARKTRSGRKATVWRAV